MSSSTWDLLSAAARGRVGVDQRFLRSIVERGDDAVPDLLRFGLEDHREDPVGLEIDLVQIFRILRTPKALDYYISLIRTQPWDIPDELVEAFLEIGKPAVDPLLALYEELGEENGGEVAFLLASLGVQDDRIRETLLARLDYDAWDAAICVGMYGDPATRPALEKLLGEISGAEDDQHLRHDVEQAITELGKPRQPHIPPEPEVIIGEYPEEAGPDFDVLPEEERIELLSNESAAVRAGAAESFVNAELGPGVRRKLFDLARQDLDSKVRAAAWRALAGEADDAQIYSAMLARVSDESAPGEERAGALVGLSMRLPEPDVRKWAEALYERTETRAAALEAMRRSLDRGFAKYFPQHLEDPDREVRRQAIWGVGYLEIAAEAETLTRYFEDEDFRADALFAYGLSARHETSRGRMPGLLRKIESAAGGLSEAEEQLVKVALDERLTLHGMKPLFTDEGEFVAESGAPEKVGRNDPCPCGSGKKFKKCCGAS